MTQPVPLDVRSRIRFRRAWAADWAAVNPVLRDGEPGFDKTRNMLKVGDGITPWNDLSYLTPPDGGYTPEGPSTDEIAAAIRAHEADRSPHSVYDDGPSLLLLYQNAKV